MTTQDTLQQIVHNFLPANESFAAAEAFGNGHINDTFKVTTEDGANAYILQRINHHVFRNVPLLQNNIITVTAHIRRKLAERGETDLNRKTLRFLNTADGLSWHYDGENYWRLCYFIPQSIGYDGGITPALAKQAGNAFGDFQAMLADMPDGAIGETIPGFHDMQLRLRQFREAVNADPVGRRQEVNDIIAEIESRADAMCIQDKLFALGKLPKRINHCDTKVNNLLFDQDGSTLCVVDLDTVMPAFVLSDIGDFIRTGANTGAEDDINLDRVGVNIEIFEAYTSGYMERALAFLTPTEIEMLPYGGKMLTYMQTVRFLTDHLNGDVYYKIHHHGHNLQRTRAQFKLLTSLEDNATEMNNFMKQWL
ncbi:MAG: aminoglycoside phosphotransferase family protein [Tannerellaceae bacterium]|jgi:Ser/Thr protein kinase RdoA (MazF antagonist)|nr:aminoglycoside phosphotransferase family protein [Tannerellaceae bacterium]